MTIARLSDANADLVQDLVDANHILFNQGVVDAFGHISARHDKHADRFLLARNMAPAIVEADDIVEFDLDGTALNGEMRRVYLERFIHGEIYRIRPDVMSIVHSHSPSVVPFSIVKSLRFRPACHVCGFLGDGADVFEIRDAGGSATDLLIRNAHLGRALAECLGTSNAVLMRGHGSTVVGPDVKIAVYRAVYTEVNAKLVTEALRLGPVEYLTREEAETALAIEKEVTRPWELWKSALRRA